MTTFRHLLANPIFRDHGRLVLGWSDDQLWAIAYLLAPYLPAGLGWRMVLAVAAVARSIVIEERLTGNGVHYSRRKENYSIPDRYAGADPRSTYHYVTGAMDILIEAGLITHEMGKWDYRRESTRLGHRRPGDADR